MFFDDFKESQNVSYSLLKNSLLKGKLSHAYLIDMNNNDDAYDFVLSFVKMILCENHYTNCSYDECKNCSKCLRIEHGNYSEIKVIEAESNIIKKDQLLELQSDFSKSSIEGSYRIYIIKDCDKMNKQASNSILKFLEEPVDGIIAILLTNHFSKILSTIISRCQVIHLNNVMNLTNHSSLENLAIMCCDSKNLIQEFVEDEKNLSILDTVISFLLYFEENGLDTLLFMKNMWYNKVQTRDESLLAFRFLIYFYYDVLRYKLNSDDFVFCDHVNSIKNVGDLNSTDSIIEKLNIVQYGYEMILSNLNVNLLLDDIIIRLGEVT